MIDTHNGHAGAPPINVDDYPAVKAHLDGSYDRLVRRQDQGITPYNLRNCAYHEHFGGAKLLWRDMASTGAFAYSDTQIFTNDKAFMMTGKNLTFLCAVLNSAPVSWLVSKSGLTTGMGLTQWKKFVVEKIPVPRPEDAVMAELDRAVTDLLPMIDVGNDEAVKRADHSIQAVVCDLYGLTTQEVDLVTKAERRN